MAKVIVLDDDPTGTQTVHSIPVLTVWDTDSLAAELTDDAPAAFILTNSRALPPDAANALAREIGENLRQAAARTGKFYGKDFVVVSRSDSTLRGHFPGEVENLVAGLIGFGTEGVTTGSPARKSSIGELIITPLALPRAPAILLMPYFAAGGRVTIGDVHYIREGAKLTPVGETEFARDYAFGYKSSNLREWVEEKTAGRVPAESVISVSLEDIRERGPVGVALRLAQVLGGCVGVVNCENDEDMRVFANGLYLAEYSGLVFLYRTAASFVAARAEISSRPLLTAAELGLSGDAGSLIVVGSYVRKTSEQLAHLLDSGLCVAVEVSVPALLSGDSERNAEITRTRSVIADALREGRDAVCYTSRNHITDPDPERGLAIGKTVSDALTALIADLPVRPRYLIAKGGITSSDLATNALNVRRAWVLGQISPGVPVWRLGDETRFPNLPYIVFPGNVGNPETLTEVVVELSNP